MHSTPSVSGGLGRVAGVHLLLGCFVVCLGLPTTGCGTAPERASGTSLTAGRGLPATDRDPLPYTPPPRPHGRTDETIALTASGGEDQARRMLPTLIEAIRDSDAARLEQLFADEVYAARSPRGQSRGRPRAAVIQRILIYARNAIIPADTSVDQLIELDHLEVTRAAARFRNRDMPGQVRPTDLVVEVPIREAGRGSLRTLLGWHLRGQMIVRPGSAPRIVAL